MKTLVLFLIALSALAPACSETPGTDTPDQTPNQSTDETPEDSSSVLLRYKRSGGFAGLTDRLIVRSDGATELVADDAPQNPFELPPELLERLRAELENLDWVQAGSEPRDVQCADCYVYEIQAGSHSVTTTAMGQSGRELAELLTLVEEIKATSSED
jgi:hypothetical protein